MKITINKKNITITILAIWFAIISIMIISNEIIIRSNKEVLLKVIPIDPRDFMRGDYVILNFNITSPHEVFNKIDKNKIKYRQKVYILLEKDNDGIFQAKSFSFKRPSNNNTFIKGEIDPYKKQIIYGIENYYVKEGKGKELEGKIRDKVYAKVKIDSYGRPKVTELLEEIKLLKQ